MTDSLYSQNEFSQFRGPSTSDKYNERIENLYKDLVYLYNKAGINDEDVASFYRRLIRDHFSLMKAIEELEARMTDLEDVNSHTITFNSSNKIDNEAVEGSSFELTESETCTYDSMHGIITLPKIASASVSKLKFVDSVGNSVIPSSFEAIAVGVTGTADIPSAGIQSSDIYNAVLAPVGSVWERNVIVDAPHAEGAEIDLYVKVPTDLAVTTEANCVIVHPYPMMGCDIISVETTTNVNVSMNDALDNYLPLNQRALYTNDDLAVGWVPPGAWSGDTDINAGPVAYYFDPLEVTGLKIRLRQSNYMIEGSKYVYSYGLSFLDLRFDKFQDTGKVIIRFDSPNEATFNQVDNVTPYIYNVSQAELPYAFSYRVLWETYPGSGDFTEGSSGSDTTTVWIEVTLNKTVGLGTPALSGIDVDFTNGGV